MRKVENTIVINVKPEKVFASFLDAKMLRDWWGVERSLIEPQLGGSYALGWGVTETGYTYVTTGVFRAYEEYRLMEITNFLYFNPRTNILGPTVLTIKIEPVDDASQLTVCQSGYLDGEDWDWYYEAVDDSWPGVLVSLKNYLEKITRNA